MVDVIGSLLGGSTLGGNAIGAAIVRLRLDSSEYQREMAAANAQTTAAANSMGASTSKYAGLAKAAFLGVGVAVAAGTVVAIKAASDLNEQINKSKEVFGAAADGVLEWSETTASSLGIARSEALLASGNFGTMFDAAGFASQAAADMSIKMTELGADIGSFNNIPVTEALEKLRAGLAGEAEPMRQLGVFLSEARVEAEAFRLGIAEVGDELTDAQKIQARYSIILEDTNKAQGDFARTVGTSLPNQLKVMKAELIDTAASIGTKLLPVALELVKALKDLLPVITAILGPLGDIIKLGAEAVAVLAKVATLKFDELSIGFTETADKFRGLITAFRVGNITADEFVERVRALETETGIYLDVNEKLQLELDQSRDATNRAAQASLEWNKILADQVDGVEGARKAIGSFARKTEDELEDWADGIKESFDTFTLSLEESEDMQATTAAGFRAATNQMLDDARRLARAMREIAGEEWINQKYVAFLSEQGPEWLIGFAELNDKQQRAAQAAWQATTEKTDNAKESLDRITGVLDTLGKGKSKHEVIIEYKYVGFDPSKPGMAGVQKSQ